MRGEWLTLLDADDRFRPGGLATLVRAARESDALAVVGQQVWADGDRQWISRFYDIPDIRDPGRKSMASNPGLLYYASPHGKLFHRSVTEGLRFSGRVLGDQPWTIRALLRSRDRIEVIGEVVYEWSRPVRSGVTQSITTTFRSSARLGVEAARIAAQAFDSVRSEADRVLPDDGPREVVLARYVERLLRSDLGVHLSKALRRGDPTAGELLAAIERFVAHVPAELLAASDAPARDILEPPLASWYRLSPSARRAYWSLFAAVLRADPNVSRRASSAPARLALRLASGGDVARRATAIALLVPAHAATVAGRVLRSRLRHRW